MGLFEDIFGKKKKLREESEDTYEVHEDSDILVTEKKVKKGKVLK